MISLWLVLLEHTVESLVIEDVIVLVEDIIEDVDFFVPVGSRRSYAKALQRKLVTGKSQALLKAIGQLGAKTPQTVAKGLSTLRNIGLRTDTLPVLNLRKTAAGNIIPITGKSDLT